MSNVIVQEQLKGVVGRELPAKNPEGHAAFARMGRYGEAIVLPLGIKPIGLVEEGSFFVATNPTISTGVKLQGDTTTAWVATTPSLLLVNNDAIGGKNIIVDYAKLLMTAAGAGLATLMAAAIIDNGNRYASGGTAVTTIANANMASGAGSIAKLYYGATASAASGTVRVVGRAVLRGAIPVVNDVYMLNFGGDAGIASAGTDGTTTIMAKGFHFPPVVIGPQQSFLLYLWAASMSTSPSCEFELAWIER